MILSMRDRLARGDVILLDGAIGTQLQAQGLGGGEAPEHWNLSRPDDVASVAAAYATAGSDVVHTNSFGATPLKLASHGLAGQAEEINRAAAAAARKGADGRALVSGSMGPCGGLLQPYGDLNPAQVAAGFTLQAKALVAGGVDLLCVETMIDLAEAVLAVTAARTALPDGVVMVSLTFEPTPRGCFTIMGNDVPTAAAELSNAGANVIGSNCGQGSAGMLEIAQAFSVSTNCPILIQPNAGLPVLKGTDVFYPESPSDMAEMLPALLAAGVRVIGGCCGTTPAHIGTMRQAIDQCAEGV